ncbi:RxLR effector candidate protein [Plasmodiophora brassicae]|uniref:RxLR effector candidate protein n=1 Tax=Plasmodiophora brassicae TaxID=37360 RepID=A0A0G4J935_PLABS|nr:hypothetical protein PBRA_009569 [Plasmodiophora brassicae]SPQ98392.1 unnamed protein product [Plasmodiophora brassicae]
MTMRVAMVAFLLGLVVIGGTVAGWGIGTEFDTDQDDDIYDDREHNHGGDHHHYVRSTHNHHHEEGHGSPFGLHHDVFGNVF